MIRTSSAAAVAVALWCTLSGWSTAVAQSDAGQANRSPRAPLHVRIDRHLAELHPGPEVGLCDDGEFLRRVYLDLVGSLPTAQQTRAFLADSSPGKRARVIDELLERPEHDEHMARVFDVMLMERRADKHVKQAPWHEYLLTSFTEQKPLNHLARELLAADGVEDERRAPAKFYLEREVEPNLLTREVGRMFFGMDVQCAQCHDHPLIADYTQPDYYGLFAFLGRSYLFQPDNKQPAVIAEKAEGDAKFKSVFTGVEGETLPRLPGGVEVPEPEFAEGEAYKVAPNPKDKKVRPVPKYSPRAELARRATDGSNDAFNRNLANRLWALMMGRGLVDPVDQHHSDNPPVHPALLQELADELVRLEFDLRAMLRQLALSRTYQRPLELPADFQPHASAAREELSGWDARQTQVKESIERLTAAVDDLRQRVAAAEKQQPERLKQQQAAAAAAKETAAQAGAAEKQLAAATKKLERQRSAESLLRQAVDQTAKAGELLPEGQDLSEVATTLAARHTAVASTREALAAEVAQLAKRAETAKRQRDQAEQQLRQTRQARQRGEQELAALKREQASQQCELDLQRTTATHVAEQIRRLQAAIEYGDALRQQRAAESERNQLEAQLARDEKKRSQRAAELKQVREQLDEAVATESKVAKTLAGIAAQRRTLQQVAALVDESLGKARQAATLLAGEQEQAQPASTEPQSTKPSSAEPPLGTAVTLLQQRAASLEPRLATLKKEQHETAERKAMLVAELESLRQREAKLSRDVGELRKRHQQRQEQRDVLAARVSEATEAVARERRAVVKAWSRQFSLAGLQPLSPEQLAFSMIRATGYDQRQREAVRAKLDKKSPLKPDAQKDPEQVAAREQEIEQQTRANLQRVVDRFVNLFGAAGGQPQDDFFATVDQALYFRNGGDLRSWLTPAGGNLTDRLRQLEDPAAIAEELYLAILTRQPDAREAAEVREYLGQEGLDKTDAVQHMAWALLTSAEFRFQH
jgi:hypothetical protein